MNSFKETFLVETSLWVWVQDFWRVQVGLKFGFGRRTWVHKGSKFIFFRFGPGFSMFLAKQVRSSGFLKGSSGFKVQFWWMNLGSSEFKV